MFGSCVRALFLAGSVFAVVLLVGALRDNTDAPKTERDPNNPVVCAEFGGNAALASGLTETELVQYLTEAWNDASGYSSYDTVPAIEYGCPTDAVLQCPGRGTPHLAILCRASRLVESPGRYLRHLFVISQTDFDLITGKSLGAYAGRQTAIEHVCYGDACQGVTDGVYIPVDELLDEHASDLALAEALGFTEVTHIPTVGEPTIDPLKWSTRAHLAACIEFADDAAPTAVGREAAAQQHVLEALGQLARDSRWNYPASLRAAADSPGAASGCPRNAALDCYGDVPITCLYENVHVSEPSEYLVFIFVVSEPQLATIVGDEDTRVAQIEQACQRGYGCRDVTSSVYITPTELEDPASLADAIGEAIGL
ncbi:MAG: hypothetical protein WD904_01040 [Dehalococcoidia bacterium]